MHPWTRPFPRNASMSWGMERNNDSCTITTVAKAECMQIEKFLGKT